MELHKRRRSVTEPECRYFVRQITLACQYLHKNRIIHRDLKLGNLFLNDEMEIKIGDFGLATKLDFIGERKRTLCGTPNYIAPEVLGKKGHSYEVDAWSLGCIVYTLLVGKPPFETSSLKDTYSRIKKNEYVIPSRVCTSARVLIQKLLQAEPASRPSMDQILDDEFFHSGCLPAGLPTSCLTMAPRFDQLKQLDLPRKPLVDINDGQGSRFAGNAAVFVKDGEVSRVEEPMQEDSAARRVDTVEQPQPADCYLSELYDILTQLVNAKPSERATINADDAEDPACIPIYYVSKWVDYSDKYGLGYQLCDNSVGVLFNDSTRLILTSNGENMQYIERDGIEHFHTLKSFPEPLTKKVTLLKYFRNYMSEHLLKAGGNIQPREGEEMTRLPFLRTWFRTRSAIVLHLSNGTMQVNFFQDHTKIILCPLMSAVTYIDEKRDVRTFRLPLLAKYGCDKELETRLKYARTMVDRLMTARSGSTRSRNAATTATTS